MQSWTRLLWANRFQVLITMLSTVLGGAALLLCFQFIGYELNFDHWDPVLERLARVEETITPPGGEPIVTVGSSRGLAPWLRATGHPMIESVTAFSQKQVTAYVGSRKVSELVSFVDADFLTTIPLSWRSAPVRRLAANEMLLSDDAARRLFGSVSPMGKVITLPTSGGENHFTVVGIYHLMRRSHFNFDWILPSDPAESTPTRSKNDWLSLGDYTYVRTRTPDGIQAMSPLIDSTIDGHIDPVAVNGAVLPPAKVWSFIVRPVQDIHLHAGGHGEMKPGGDVRMLEFIGLLTLCIAVVVVTNLANQALLLNSKRARELAVRRLVGEGRNRQTVRTITAFTVLVFGALLAAYAAAVIAGPLLAAFLNVNGAWTLEAMTELAYWSVGFAALLSLLCGIAATFGAHGQNIALLLRRGIGEHAANVRMRTAMFCLQLALGSALASGCLGVWLQLARLQNTPAGMSVENGMVLLDARFHRDFNDNLSTLRKEVEKLAGVRSVAFVSDVPGRPLTAFKGVARDDVASGVYRTAAYVAVSANVPEALGLKLIAGRFFASESGADVLVHRGHSVNMSDAAVLINANLAGQLGFTQPQQAVGARLRLQEPAAVVVVIGVTDDFRYAGIQQPVEPLMMAVDDDSIGHALVMLYPGAAHGTGSGVLAAFDRLIPGEGLRLESLEVIWNGQFSRIRTLALLSSLLLGTAVVLIGTGVVAFVSIIVRANAKLSVLMRLHGARRWHAAWFVLSPALAAGLAAAVLGAAATAYALSDWSRQFLERVAVLPAAACACVGICVLVMGVAVLAHEVQARRLTIAGQLRTE